MNRQLRSKLGYIPIAAGFILIAVGVDILVTHVVLNKELAIPNWHFWFYWAPVITVLLIAGAIFTVTGLLINLKIKSILSYALAAGGFLLISFDSYFLIGDWVRDSRKSKTSSSGWNPHIGTTSGWRPPRCRDSRVLR